MNTLHRANVFIFTATIGLYITIYLGLLAQIFLGAFQVISAIILLFKIESFNTKIQIHLTLYSIITLIYLTFFFGMDKTLLGPNFTNYILAYALLPLSIAGYFLYITYLIKEFIWYQKYEDDSNLDYQNKIPN